MFKTKPTVSVRKCGFREDLWLRADGTWGRHDERHKFPTQDAAEAAVAGFFGEDFSGYGLFPNSVPRRRAA